LNSKRDPDLLRHLEFLPSGFVFALAKHLTQICFGLAKYPTVLAGGFYCAFFSAT
jgi:hypothetical protein